MILDESLVLLRRAITFQHTNGLLTSVTDWTGRTVTYDYYDGVELGGSLNDLKSVTTPVVIGTPNDNDFPGKTTSYTYTSDSPGAPAAAGGSGSPYSDVQSYCRGYVWDCVEIFTTQQQQDCNNDPDSIWYSNYPKWCCRWVCRGGANGQPDTVDIDATFGQLYHNLLTITDAKGELILQNTYAEYSPLLGAADPLFDHIVSQEYGGDTFSFAYAPVADPEANNGAVRQTTVNNRMGQVKTLYYDPKNRLVMRWDYTGLVPDGSTVTPPLGVAPVRSGDPGEFVTTYEYNDDSRKTKITHPNGNVETFVYAFDVDPNIDRRLRGNLLTHAWSPGTHATPTIDQPTMIKETFTYWVGGGGCCGFNFVETHTDGRKNDPGESVTLNDTVNDYDNNGNRITTTHRDGGIEEWTYNESGQVLTHTLP